MSNYVFCQACPEDSTLFTRLKTDARMYRLYVHLLPYGRGPFWASELDPDELAVILDDLARSPQGEQVFANTMEVKRTLDALQREIKEACTRYPGLENRACFLDKTYEEIYERLSEYFESNHQTEALILLAVLFDGDQTAMRPLELPEAFGDIGVVTAAEVKNVASILTSLPPEVLFDPVEEDWLAEDYGSLRTVYLDAALRDEAIVV